MTLRPGAFEKYKQAHENLWPDLAAGMRENEVNMAIYCDGDRLFLFAQAPSLAHWERSRHDPILTKWDDKMTEFLQADEKGGIAFTLLPKVFGFGDFAA